MSEFYIHHLSGIRVGLPQAANLKIINDKGVELSLAFDDSCGCAPNLSRVSMAVFNGPNMSDRVGEEIFGVDADDFLQALAKHLGYSVTKDA